MRRRKIYFRADASAEIGYGHFIRTLALADMLKDNFECTFFTQSPSEYQLKEVEKVCSLKSLPADNSKFEIFLQLLTGKEIVVLDNYYYTSGYQKKIKDRGCNLVCIDDMHDKHYYADIVINHGLTNKALFDAEPYSRLCLGFDYALLRKPFLKGLHFAKIKNSWFISFGGTDYLNLTEKVLNAIYDDERVESIIVVIGNSYKYEERLINYSKAIIKKNVSAEEMAEAMQRCQYAILPSSSVCIEALASGCKIAAGYFVENQKPYYDEWNHNGFIMGLGNMTGNISKGIVDQLSTSNLHVKFNFNNIASNYVEVFNNL